MSELDPVIHAQARLRVTATLATLPRGDSISFPRLQGVLQMTAGNLSTHLRKLEDARYVDVVKTHAGRTPVTFIALTAKGRMAFEDYTQALRDLLATPAGIGSPIESSSRTGGSSPTDSSSRTGGSSPTDIGTPAELSSRPGATTGGTR